MDLDLLQLEASRSISDRRYEQSIKLANVKQAFGLDDGDNDSAATSKEPSKSLYLSVFGDRRWQTSLHLKFSKEGEQFIGVYFGPPKRKPISISRREVEFTIALLEPESEVSLVRHEFMYDFVDDRRYGTLRFISIANLKLNDEIMAKNSFIIQSEVHEPAVGVTLPAPFVCSIRPAFLDMPVDVIFKFNGNKKLYANQAFLAKQCTYFANLFSKEYAEGNGNATSNLDPVNDNICDDSDDYSDSDNHIDKSENFNDYETTYASADKGKEFQHTDSLGNGEKPPTVEGDGTIQSQEISPLLSATTSQAEGDQAASSGSGGRDSKRRKVESHPGAADMLTIQIPNACIHTYRALLIWLYTKTINFKAYDENLMIFSDNHSPTRPVVSPRSLYRLADMLDIDDLRQMCLERFANSLTPSQAVKCLGSSIIHDLPELREVLEGYISENATAIAAIQTDKLQLLLAKQVGSEATGELVAMLIAAAAKGAPKSS